MAKILTEYGLDPVDRFWRLVDRDVGVGECHPWLGALDKDGYGLFQLPGRTVRAHRWIYGQAVEPLVPGSHVDHRCHTRECPGGPCAHRRCMNLSHLLQVSPKENVSRGHAGFGPHERDEESGRYVPLSARGGRT